MTRPRPIAEIVSTGRYLPDRVLTNADWVKMVDTTDQWIQERTGIRERRLASPCTSVCDMGTAAAQQALERAGVNREGRGPPARVHRHSGPAPAIHRL